MSGLAISFLVLAAVQLPWVECAGHALHLAGTVHTTSECAHDHHHGHDDHSHDAPVQDSDHDHIDVSWDFPAPNTPLTLVAAAPCTIDAPVATHPHFDVWFSHAMSMDGAQVPRDLSTVLRL